MCMRRFLIYSFKAVAINFCDIHLVLDPTLKMKHFEKNWPEDLHAKVQECAEEVVCD